MLEIAAMVVVASSGIALILLGLLAPRPVSSRIVTVSIGALLTVGVVVVWILSGPIAPWTSWLAPLLPVFAVLSASTKPAAASTGPFQNTQPIVEQPVMAIDPLATSESLAHLAAAEPSRWNEILAHPSCYPELAEWIRSQQLPETSGFPGWAGSGR